MLNYKTYSHNKDSGVEWLGDIPNHWNVKRLKRVCVFRYGDTLPDTNRNDGQIPVYGSNGIVGFHDENNTLSPSIVVGRKGSYGKLNYSLNEAFAIDTTYYIDARTTTYDIRWLYYALLCLRLDEGSKDSAVPGLAREDAYKYYLPDYSLLEQQTIAAFLDLETTRIDALIQKKERMIELLKEKRIALITQAVTKGLNPNVPMKDSGIEWLGAVPEHWSVLAFKNLGEFMGGAGFPDEEQGLEDEDIPFYKVSDTNTRGNEMYMNVHNNSISRETAKKLRAYVLPNETIIFAKVGAALLLNKRRILTRDSCIDNNMMGFVSNKCDILWCYYFFCLLDLGKLVNPGAVPSVNEEQMKNIPVCVPPAIDQREIGNYISLETAKMDRIIEKIVSSTIILREYRASLIHHAVTGKIDLRGYDAQAQ